MNKQKNLLLALIIIIFLSVNYAVYNLYFSNKINQINQQKSTYFQVLDKINKIEESEKKLEKLISDNEKLKSNSETLDSMAPKQIDTPQLVYDFYTSCAQYNIKGEELDFDLGEKDDQEKTAEDKKDQGDKKEDKQSNFQKLTIDLKVSGNRNDIEQYIRNLQGITKRQLNIKSIKILTSEAKDKDAKEQEGIDNNSSNKTKTSYNSNKTTVSSNPVKLTKKFDGAFSRVSLNGKLVVDGIVDNGIYTNDTPKGSFVTDKKEGTTSNDNTNTNLTDDNENATSIINSDVILAEIIFYQYIQGDGKDFDVSKAYDFYDKNTGFESIADMFKKK